MKKLAILALVLSGVVRVQTGLAAEASVDLDFNRLVCTAEADNPSEIRQVVVTKSDNQMDLTLLKRGAMIQRQYSISNVIPSETRVSVFGKAPMHWIQVTYDPTGAHKAIIVTEIEDGRLPCVIE
jgi:hypothetical protein